MDLFFFRPDSPLEWTLAGAFALGVLYFIVQYRRSRRHDRFGGDEHVAGCLHFMSWGCLVPVTAVLLVVIRVVG